MEMSPKSNNQEYELAMQTLEELCAAHRIKSNDKLREIFWEGVVHGWNRAAKRVVRRDQSQKKPIRPKTAPPAALRDSRVESSVGGMEPQAPRREKDLSDAGVFRL